MVLLECGFSDHRCVPGVLVASRARDRSGTREPVARLSIYIGYRLPHRGGHSLQMLRILSERVVQISSATIERVRPVDLVSKQYSASRPHANGQNMGRSEQHWCLFRPIGKAPRLERDRYCVKPTPKLPPSSWGGHCSQPLAIARRPGHAYQDSYGR